MTAWTKAGNPDCLGCSCVEGPCVSVCATIRDACTHVLLSGVDVADTQGGTTTTCTTGGTGRCCDAAVSGAYSVVVSKSGYVSTTVTGTATCPPPPSPIAYGPNYPATLTSDATIGSVAWTNPGDAGAFDSAFATSTSTGSTPTQYLKGLALGFAVTDDGTQALTGIKLEVNWKADAPATDSSVRLVVGGVIQAHEMAVGTGIPHPGAATQGYGSANNLWGTTGLTIADVNGPAFGFALSVQAPGSGGGTPGSAGPFATSTATDGGSGVFTWTNPGNATATDGTFATAISNNSQSTDLLVATCGAASRVPAGATLTSITFRVQVKASGGVPTDDRAYVVIGGIPQTGTNLAASTTLGTTLGPIDYTASSGLPTAAQFNSSGMGLAWSGVNGGVTSRTISVDSIAILSVSYTVPGDTTIGVDFMRATVYTSTQTYELAISLLPATLTVPFLATACQAGCPLAGVTCEVTGTGGTWTATTGADGKADVVCAGITAGAYTLSMTPPAPFAPFTFTPARSLGPACGSVFPAFSHLFTAVPDHFCCCPDCYDPFPAGPLTLSWPANCFFPGDPAASFTLTRRDPGTSTIANYDFDGSGNPSVSLSALYCTTGPGVNPAQVIAHGFLVRPTSGTIGCPTAFFCAVTGSCGVTVTG